MGDGVGCMTQEQEGEQVCTKTSGWTHEDVGKRIVKRETPNGTYFNELVVNVFFRKDFLPIRVQYVSDECLSHKPPTEEEAVPGTK